MPSYIIWIPFEFRGGDEIDLDTPIELNVCGYPSALRKRSRFKGLEIRSIPSEDAAQRLLKQVTGALLCTVVAQGPQIRFELEPVPIVYKEDDRFIYLDPDRVRFIWEEPFQGGRTAIYRDDKQLAEWSIKTTLTGIVNPERLVNGFLQCLASPSLRDGIADPTTIFAADLYCSVAFEASARARFLTLCTVLEVLAPTRSSPVAPVVASQINQWVADAHARRKDVQEQTKAASERGKCVEAKRLKELDNNWESTARRLGNLKTISITTSLKDRVKALLEIDRQSDAAERLARVTELYNKRHKIVHAGEDVTSDELFELDDIVRMVLIAAIRNPERH